MKTLTHKRSLTIVAFGNSITQAVEQPENLRWPALLGIQFARELPGQSVKVINAGVGGNTSREGLLRIDADVLIHRPDLVLVEFGGNDATYEEHRHVNHEEYWDNLELLRRKIIDESKARMVLLTFTPVINAWHACCQYEYYLSRGGQDAFIETYRVITRAFAREKGVPLIPIDLALRQAMSAGGNEKVILPDGVHLTADGNDVVARTVFEGLQTVLGS
jgi:lysophospholipase L1-like esterase